MGDRARSKTSPSPLFVTGDGLRGRFYALLEHGSFAGPVAAALDVVLALLILLNVLAVALETVPRLADRYGEVFLLLEIVSVSIFTAEYIGRVWVSVEADLSDPRPLWRQRVSYMLSPLAIIDLIAIFPFYLVAMGSEWLVLRLFRLLRLLKLVRHSAALESLGRVLYQERRTLLAALLIMVAAMLTAATVLHLIEGSNEGSEFSTIPDALWWAIATLTTVGYGDVVPATVGGKIAGGIVMVFGLAFYAIPIGILASGFSQEIRQRHFTVPVSALKAMPIFNMLDEGLLSELGMRIRSVSLSPNTVVLHRHDDDCGLFIVVSGEVHIVAREGRFALGAGDMFGDHGPIFDADGTAAALTRAKSRLLVLPRRDLETLLGLSSDFEMAFRTASRAQIERLGHDYDLTPDCLTQWSEQLEAMLPDEPLGPF